MFERSKLASGMVVRSSDGDKLGKIVAIDEDGFVVEKGIFFPKDYRASFTQVHDTSGDEVYLKWGTDLVETNYDTTYGAGSYKQDTSDSSLWQDYDFRKGGLGSSEERREHMSIPLREEELQVERKGMQEKGRVRIYKTVHTEDKSFTVPLRREEVHIERVPIDSAGLEGEIEEKTVEIPIQQEEAVISKRTVAKEALKVSTESKTIEQPVREEIRKEDARIERDDVNLGADLKKKKAV